MAEWIDLTGRVVGELRAIRYLGGKKWLCECSCGREVEKFAASLRAGRAKVCSRSFHAQRNNQKHPAEYQAWQWAKRQQKLIPAWADDFEEFFAGVGRKPHSSAVLVRLDESALMGPQNFRWANHRNER
jgi:hypothetical protein